MAWLTAPWNARRAASSRSWVVGRSGIGGSPARSGSAGSASSVVEERELARRRRAASPPASAPRASARAASRAPGPRARGRAGRDRAGTRRDSRPPRGRRPPPRGTAARPARRATPTWTAPVVMGSRGIRSHSKRASSTSSTSLHGARPRYRGEPAQVGEDLRHRLAVGPGPDPLVEDHAQALGPFGPGRLAGQAVERPGEPLRPRRELVGVRGALEAPRPARPPRLAWPRPRARRRRGREADASSAAGSDTICASRLSWSHCSGRPGPRRRAGSRQGTGAKVRNSITAGRSEPAAAEEQQQRARRAPGGERQRRMEAAGDAAGAAAGR